MDDIEIVVTPQTVKRISRDVKNIIKNPLHENGIFYEHNMDNIFQGHALIIGPKNTPYENGFYFFEFNFPSDYPHTPPTLKFLSNGDNIRFNPNLYRTGKVCISILNTWTGEQWTSCQSISSILLTLCTVLNENPLLNEPGVTKYDPQIQTYNIIVGYKNVEVCILRMIENIKNNLKPYSLFKDQCLEHFEKNKENIINYIKNIENLAKESTYRNNKGYLYTNIYKMTTKINKNTIKTLINTIQSSHSDLDQN